ncbi:MAG: phosphoribosyl-AMP cyclohydrolase [Vicinamibacterales bacterium]
MDFTKLGGLIPAVVQDMATRDVLMVGFMNEDAYARTVASGYATFYSRSRGTLWMKGETSGNRLRVERMSIDCDNDTLLLQVTCEGDGVACHTGARSCFGSIWEPTSGAGPWDPANEEARRGAGAPAGEK